MVNCIHKFSEAHDILAEHVALDQKYFEISIHRIRDWKASKEYQDDGRCN